MNLVDRIYEAAFVPELWPVVLGDIGALVNSASAALLIVDPRMPPRYACTPDLIEFSRAFAASPAWYDNPRLERALRQNYSGFMEQSQFTNEEQRQTDFLAPDVQSVAQAWQAGSTVQMPGGEIVLFNFVRAAEQDNFAAPDIAMLDGLRPHLARASLLAARLGLERAEANVQALNVVGIPAAVMTGSGVVLATNSLFEALGDILRPAAFGRISARDRAADRLLQSAVSDAGQLAHTAVRSFPIRSRETDRAVVLHVIPLHRSASDIFERGTVLIVVSGYAVDGNVPSDAVLRGLFDLSPAEAGIAAGLAAGQTVSEIAAARGIGLATARTHLAQIFRKTGTGQQGQLVALLKGVSAPPG